MRPFAVLLVALVGLTGCGTDDPTAREATPSGSAAAPTATTTAGAQHRGGPPPFRLRYDGHLLVLHPSTYCYGSGCADGTALAQYDVGSPREILVRVPLAGLRLQASLWHQDLRGRCAYRLLTKPVGRGWVRLRPAGPAGAYLLELSASGDGDMSALVRWTTPVGGPDRRNC